MSATNAIVWYAIPNFINSLKVVGFSAVLIFIGMDLPIEFKALSAKCYMISFTNIQMQLIHVTGNVVSLPHFKFSYIKLGFRLLNVLYIIMQRNLS